jgi:hypothetical protein
MFVDFLRCISCSNTRITEKRLVDKIKRFLVRMQWRHRSADRVNNEYSHVLGLFERVSLPMDPPLMQTVAKCVLDRLKLDKDQYSSLLRSIDVAEDAKDAIAEKGHGSGRGFVGSHGIAHDTTLIEIDRKGEPASGTR